MLCASLSSVCYAQSNKADTDSATVINLEEVSIQASRATARTPIAFTNLQSEQLSAFNLGQDVPFLLQATPSVIATSDAGTGVGYTSIRVRGTDATRINVSANGIPINNSESHQLYWVNTPDLISSASTIQIQRGAGISNFGSASFGGSIDMTTDLYTDKRPSAEFAGSYGMYNTHKETLKVASGLLRKHWTADLRLSNIGSDGYIERAFAHLWSYKGQVAYVNDNTLVRLLAFGGKERTYHAWNYATKEEMETYGRRYNSCGQYTDDQGNTAYYPDQTDNYIQHNFQLILDRRFTPEWSLNAALHYTKGDGYYQEYKTRRTLKEYGLTPFVDADGNLQKKSDLIRRKKMDNGFGGGVFAVNYRSGIVDATLGGAANHYGGYHFGQIAWVKNYLGPLAPDQEYYRNKGKKTDANIYARADVDIARGFSAYADLQYRHIDYKINGVNDRYDYVADQLQTLNVHEKFNFFNPKLGVNWRINNHHRLFASFAVAQKEPSRDCYTKSQPNLYPTREKLYDYEIGYTFNRGMVSAAVNLYYMSYRDQLVPTGMIGDTGELLTMNVPDSYRAGIELMFGLKPVDWFAWNVNATFSRNRIKNFTETIYDDDYANPITFFYKDTPIAFSPSVILGNIFSFNYRNFTAVLQSQYVSKQYMTNVKSDEQAIDPYFVTNLHLGYDFKLRHCRRLHLGFTVNNLFSAKYSSNGYAGAGYYRDEQGEAQVYRYAYYSAQAPINVIGSVIVSF